MYKRYKSKVLSLDWAWTLPPRVPGSKLGYGIAGGSHSDLSWSQPEALGFECYLSSCKLSFSSRNREEEEEEEEEEERKGEGGMSSSSSSTTRSSSTTSSSIVAAAIAWVVALTKTEAVAAIATAPAVALAVPVVTPQKQ
ncbi:hypothetical protein PoB_000483700 [Plakobranchus ocellatus]|uniref:Uncharacterized protein n=1 Tax=Plakobranchus ocellatus TaxID=259542 RepID=A0AAV3Y6A8_9GAST|nr:hypothetical protein PoB_000483700 [Plakobranchus ocellatus]